MDKFMFLCYNFASSSYLERRLVFMIRFEDDVNVVEESTAIAIGLSTVEQKISTKDILIFIFTIVTILFLLKGVCS